MHMHMHVLNMIINLIYNIVSCNNIYHGNEIAPLHLSSNLSTRRAHSKLLGLD